jgi:hypothetical protein
MGTKMSGTSENIRKQLIELLSDFEIKLKSEMLPKNWTGGLGAF